jgi:hypothetical protein
MTTPQDPHPRPSTDQPAEGPADDDPPEATPPHPEQPAEGERAPSAQDAP